MLQVIQPTDEQTQEQNSKKEELHNSVKNAFMSDPIQKEILKDLGLSPAVEEATAKKVKTVPVEEEAQEDVHQEETTEETTEDTEETEESEEEVIPKSKVQKRFDELTSRLKAQEQELAELKASRAEPKDEVTKQLEEMTLEQLKSARLEVRRAQIKAQDDDTKINELLALEEKIDSAYQSYGQRFSTKQATVLNKAIIKSGVDEATYKKVFADAKNIYEKYPLFQKDINGQAHAWEMALEHYKIISSTVKTGDKTKETELKRQVNNLKKKTTLETKSTNGNLDKANMDKLRKNAINGTQEQKINLIKSHPAFNVAAMIPEEYRS